VETTLGVKTSHLLAVDHLPRASGVLHLATVPLIEGEDPGERATRTKASPAGGVTKMIAGERQNLLVEMIRQARRMETPPGVITSHLLAVDPLSWVSGVLLLPTLQLVEGVDPLSSVSGALLLSALQLV